MLLLLFLACHGGCFILRILSNTFVNGVVGRRDLLHITSEARVLSHVGKVARAIDKRRLHDQALLSPHFPRKSPQIPRFWETQFSRLLSLEKTTLFYLAINRSCLPLEKYWSELPHCFVRHENNIGASTQHSPHDTSVKGEGGRIQRLRKPASPRPWQARDEVSKVIIGPLDFLRKGQGN